MRNTLYKQPRTYHLVHSPGCKGDDKRIHSNSQFWGRTVVVSEKMDGEAITMYPHTIHQRSLSSNCGEEWNSRIKALWARVRHRIPEGMRVSGEGLTAKHSIYYDDLEDCFLVYAIWKDEICLSAEDTAGWCDYLGLKTVPVIFFGAFDQSAIHGKWTLHKQSVSRDSEGYVVRNADSFHRDDFKRNVAKYVREGHVQTDKHWKSEPKTMNRLKYA